MANQISEDFQIEQDALQKWGYMIKPDKRPSPNLDRLLRGISAYISSHFGPTDHNDLVPSQLAAFYRAVGGNYDSLFLEMPPQSISFIYMSLGCLHSLQPLDSDGHAPPYVPALKPRGFVNWQTIQILLGPEEHVPFLQNALKLFDILDPETGYPLAKYLPASAFPSQPDPDMETWHHSVSERLRLEAEPGEPLKIEKLTDRTSVADLSTAGSVEERTNAANYFSNPFNRNREGKPGIVAQIKQAPAKVFQGGKLVASTVFQGGKMVADPRLFSRRKSSMSNRSASAEASTDRRHGSGQSTQPYDRTIPASGRSSGSRRSPRRHRSPSTSSSDSEVDRNRPRRMRRYVSNDTTPRTAHVYEYPEVADNTLERSTSNRGRAPYSAENQPSTFKPSDSPPMAVRMAHGYNHRSQISQRPSSEHRGPNERPHVLRPRHYTNDSSDRWHEDHRAASNSRPVRVLSPPQHHPAQPQYPYVKVEDYETSSSQDTLRPPLQRYNSEGRGDRVPEHNQGRRKSYDAGRDGIPAQQPGMSGVNGVGGRVYPSGTPWK